MSEKIDQQADLELRLVGVACPLNYIRARIFLEKQMAVVLVRFIVDAGEAALSVKRSLLADHFVFFSEASLGDTEHALLFFSQKLLAKSI